MYCDGVGHKASNCNKASSSATKAKGHAAKVDTPAVADSPASEKA